MGSVSCEDFDLCRGLDNFFEGCSMEESSSSSLSETVTGLIFLGDPLFLAPLLGFSLVIPSKNLL